MKIVDDPNVIADPAKVDVDPSGRISVTVSPLWKPVPEKYVPSVVAPATGEVGEIPVTVGGAGADAAATMNPNGSDVGPDGFVTRTL